MQRDLQHLRKSYDKGALVDEQLPANPYDLFNQWFKEAREHISVDEANAMSLSSISTDGFPKSRIVLLKEIEKGDFIFYTNYNSEKGEAMELNNKVALHFFWPALERQIIIKGLVSKVSREKSLAYFKQRPKGSQLGAWASDQSKSVPSRVYLEERLQFFEDKYKDQEIPLPDHWGGYRVSPVSIEYWQGRPNRLHDRYIYKLMDNAWKTIRLAP